VVSLLQFLILPITRLTRIGLARRGLVDQEDPREDMSARATASICCSPPVMLPRAVCGACGSTGKLEAEGEVARDVPRACGGRREQEVLLNRQLGKEPPPLRHHAMPNPTISSVGLFS